MVGEFMAGERDRGAETEVIYRTAFTECPKTKTKAAY